MNKKVIKQYLKQMCYAKHYEERRNAACNLLAEIDNGELANWEQVQRVGYMAHDILHERRWRKRRQIAKYILETLFEEDN